MFIFIFADKLRLTQKVAVPLSFSCEMSIDSQILDLGC